MSANIPKYRKHKSGCAYVYHKSIPTAVPRMMRRALSSSYFCKSIAVAVSSTGLNSSASYRVKLARFLSTRVS